VLLVDDDHLVRRALARMLTRQHEVVEAASGSEALRLIEGQHFDVMVTDLVMSHGGGGELIETLEQQGSPLARRAIVISGMAPDATRLGCPRLPKPCNASDLLATIERVLANASDAVAVPDWRRHGDANPPGSA
jgi:CheY-like chemotaxis protein